jgi:hypothetical protein
MLSEGIPTTAIARWRSNPSAALLAESDNVSTPTQSGEKKPWVR